MIFPTASTYKNGIYIQISLRILPFSAMNLFLSFYVQPNLQWKKIPSVCPCETLNNLRTTSLSSPFSWVVLPPASDESLRRQAWLAFRFAQSTSQARPRHGPGTAQVRPGRELLGAHGDSLCSNPLSPVWKSRETKLAKATPLGLSRVCGFISKIWS